MQSLISVYADRLAERSAELPGLFVLAVIVFLVFFLANVLLQKDRSIKRQLRRLRTWISEHRPIMCDRCGYPCFAKHSCYRVVTDAVVRICKDCDQELFTPFSK